MEIMRCVPMKRSMSRSRTSLARFATAETGKLPESSSLRVRYHHHGRRRRGVRRLRQPLRHRLLDGRRCDLAGDARARLALFLNRRRCDAATQQAAARDASPPVVSALICLVCSTPTANAGPGDLDVRFGKHGQTQVPGQVDSTELIALPDGRILVFGLPEDHAARSNGSIAVARSARQRRTGRVLRTGRTSRSARSAATPSRCQPTRCCCGWPHSGCGVLRRRRRG